MEPRKNAVECQLPTFLPVQSAIAEKARFPPDLRALRKKSERLTGSALGWHLPNAGAAVEALTAVNSGSRRTLTTRPVMTTGQHEAAR